MAEIKNTHDIVATDHQVDRISDLPADVISNILSRLPTIQALRTSVLAQDWKHKWTSIYDIEIGIHDFVPPQRYRSCESHRDIYNRVVPIFQSFVDKLLDSNRGLSITSLDLFIGYSCDSSILLRWISKLVSLGIEKLSIVGLDDQRVVLPGILECCTSLTELYLELNCSWEVQVKNCFPKVKRLHLSGDFGIINKQSPKTGQLLLSFPVLEILELAPDFEFLDANLVEIDVPELISLEFRGVKSPSDYVMKIRAPKLVRFVTLQGPTYDFILSKPSLRYVNYWGGDRESEVLTSQVTALLNLLKRAPNLEFLDFSGEIMTAHVLPTFNQLKRLKLRVCQKDIWKFLHVTPYLESLLMLDCYEDFIHFPETLPACSQLKQVTFGNFGGKKLELALVEFFLKNAKKLEEVFVHPCRNVDMEGVEITSWMRYLGPQNSSRITVVGEYGSMNHLRSPMEIVPLEIVSWWWMGRKFED